MAKIPVIWKSYHEHDGIIARGYWDQGIVEDLLKTIPEFSFKHQSDFTDLKENQGGIVVLNGRTHTEDIEQINADIAKLRWCLLIITGDEEGLFPWQDVKHPLLRVWVQLPRMNQHNDVSFKLPNGARPNTRKLLKEIGLQDRPIDYYFAGQINHARREQCLEAAESLQGSSLGLTNLLVSTEKFGEEKLDYKEYLTNMAQAKIVLCPSGIETPDTFRLYEALEAGCLPIVDTFATRNQSPGFWQYLFDGDVPFPIVDYWDKLPKLLPELLRDYPNNANKVFVWWQNYKRNMRFKLIKDIKEVSR